MLRLPVKPAVLAFAACVVAAPAARAGEAACWYENGVVVVTAEVAGVVGDYILDTGQGPTQLAETQAQAAGYEATELTSDIRLAGVVLHGQPVTVADIDVRTGLLPTPIAGVIGAEALKGLVLDVSFTPCRIGLYPPLRAPRLRRAKAVPLTATDGVWTVPARVSDGATSRAVRLVPATGSDAPVRVSEAFADAAGAEPPAEAYPYGVLRPRLRALSFADEIWEEQPAGLLKAETGVDGWLGAPVLARFRLRFDFPRRRLLLTPP